MASSKSPVAAGVGIDLPFVIPGFQEYSVELQIPLLRFDDKKDRTVGRKMRLLDERAVAEPRDCLNPIWGRRRSTCNQNLFCQRRFKAFNSYILKKPVGPLIWTCR
jgi:hypothetical protein